MKKKKGNYHNIYNDINFLNTAIVTDVPDLFSGFFIDLRDVKTKTEVAADKSALIRLFENLLNGIPSSTEELRQIISPSTKSQYLKGI